MRRALLVGIDDYPASRLSGCVADATTLAELLATHDDGTPNFGCKTLLAPGEEVTAEKVLESVETLLSQPADVALFYFSGHGTENNLGGYLMTQGAKKYSAGVAMRDVLTQARNSPVKEIVVILDCCHSGLFGSLPEIDNTAVLREGISVLTASRGSQVALEAGGGGVFTSLVYDALHGGAADISGNVTIAGVYTYADQALGAWDQRPLFKAHVAQFTPLRRCTPTIDPAVLRRLTKYFPTAIYEFPLDPCYEPTDPAAKPECTAIFAHLQKYRAARLLEPVGTEHMYYAAIDRKSCRLTALGRFYWHLVKANRI